MEETVSPVEKYLKDTIAQAYEIEGSSPHKGHTNLNVNFNINNYNSEQKPKLDPMQKMKMKEIKKALRLAPLQVGMDKSLKLFKGGNKLPRSEDMGELDQFLHGLMRRTKESLMNTQEKEDMKDEKN